MAMPAREVPEKFLVAFSLAGEQRDLVRPIVEAVERELGRSNVFFDEWFEHYIAGAGADLKLQEIYATRCVLAVVCVSERYGGKPWTQTEHEAIRARQMLAQNSRDTRDRDGILPIRVGDGEVPGILFTAIVPDVRKRTPGDAARLIIDRLRFISPLVDQGAVPPDWPEHPPTLRWPIADHSEARTAFEQLLTRNATFRFLPVQGPTELGKTHITKQMLGNALLVPDLACGRFDFKGTIDIDAEVRAFVQQLEAPVPPAGLRLNERLGLILDALKQRARPALLVFDTYEAAGEAQDWVEKQLLPSLIRASWLRVVIVGQKVPEPAGAFWETVSAGLILLQPPPAKEWLLFFRQYDPATPEDFVTLAYERCGGKASIMAGLLGPKR